MANIATDAFETVIKQKETKNLLRDTIGLQLNCLKGYMPNYVSNVEGLWKTPLRMSIEPHNEQHPRMAKQDRFEKRVAFPNNFNTIRRIKKTSVNNKFIPKNFSSLIKKETFQKSFFSPFYYSAMMRFSAISNSGNDFKIDLSRLHITDHIKTVKAESASTNENQKPFDLEENLIEFDETLDWEDKVINSHLPVVVDCYADWCGPCKKLFPILKKKYEENKNFRLVKINIDENQELAEKLNISSIPAVFLVYKANIVDNFVGLPNQQKLDQFFDNINLLQGVGNDESVFQALLVSVDEYMKKRDYKNANKMLEESRSHEKMSKKYAYLIKMSSAIIALNDNDYQKSLNIVKDIRDFHINDLKTDITASKKVNCIALRAEILNEKLSESQVSELVEKTKENPKDMSLRFELCQKLFLQENYSAAVNELLEMIKIDKNWENKKAHNMLLQIFNIIGGDSKMIVEARKNLAKLLY